MASASHIRAIKTLQGRAKLDDGDYRALMQRETGRTSSRALTDPEAERFIAVLRGFAPGAAPAARSGRATGKYAPVLQALWLSGYHLGLIANRDDRALLAFVERQTGVSHTRFLVDHADANRAIEALKAWLARDGGVDWSEFEGDPLGRKMAVAHAIGRRLQEIGAFTPFLNRAEPWPDDYEALGETLGLPASFGDYTSADWDRFIAHLGTRLRAARAGTKRRGGQHGQG